QPPGVMAPTPNARSWISFAMFAADGKSVWIGSESHLLKDGVLVNGRGELAQYDLATGQRLRTIEQPDSYPRALSPDASLSVWTQRLRPRDDVDRRSGKWEEKIVVRRTGPMDRGDVVFQIKNEEHQDNTLLDRAAFSPDGKRIVLHSHWLVVGL